MIERTIKRTSFDASKFDAFEFELSDNRTVFSGIGPAPNQGHQMANFRAGDYSVDWFKDLYDPSLDVGEVVAATPLTPAGLTLERSENKTEFEVDERELFNVLTIDEVGTYRITGRLNFRNPDVGTAPEDFTPSIWYFFPNDNPYYSGSIDDLGNYADVYYGGETQYQNLNGSLSERISSEFDYTFVVDPRLGGKTSLMISSIDYTGATLTNNQYFGNRYGEVLNDTWFRIERLSSTVADDGLFYYWG